MLPRVALISILTIASVAAAAPVAQRASLKEGAIYAGDYPPAATTARQEGTVVATYLVAADGGVTQCRVAETSGSKALDARTCEVIVQRFRFNPARDASGNVIAEWRTQKINWQLPVAANDRHANASRKGELLVYLAKNGSVDSCEVLKSSGDNAWDQKMCIMVGSSQTFEPARGPNGRPQKSKRVVPVWE